MSAANPRIGIIGTGAIGGFYGLMLARAGFDVHFLLRSEYDAVLARGLHDLSWMGRALFAQRLEPHAIGGEKRGARRAHESSRSPP